MNQQTKATFWTRFWIVICSLVVFGTTNFTLNIVLQYIPWEIFVKADVFQLLFIVSKTVISMCYSAILILPLFVNTKKFENIYEALLNCGVGATAGMSLMAGIGFATVYMVVSRKLAYIFTCEVALSELGCGAMAILGWYFVRQQMITRREYVSIRR